MTPRGFLHAYADLGRIEELRSPGVSGDTFDVLGEAIASRERRASFAVANVGIVPSVSAFEEAADSLLRLEGVSTAAVFGTPRGNHRHLLSSGGRSNQCGRYPHGCVRRV